MPNFTLPIPRQWSKQIKSAFIHTISLASTAFTSTCALASKRKSTVTRQKAELAQAYQEIALLKEEMQIKDDRLRRIPAHRRPYYTSIQRLQILKLKAARRWSIHQTAKAFLLDELTIFSWMKRVDEEGERSLIQLREPVSRFPDFVRSIVRQFKVFFPGMGKVKIAQVLARAGLHLGATTVNRMLKEEPPWTVDGMDSNGSDVVSVKPSIVTAKYPDYVYYLDLTTVPTSAGFWVSWLPFSLLQLWPFCWWVLVVIDHFSRNVVGFPIFKKKPSSRQVCSFLGRSFGKAGAIRFVQV